MTINNEKHIDELVDYITRPGYRDLSLSFKLKKGIPVDHPDYQYEEIEINLDKKDASELLHILFELYRGAYADNLYPEDWDESKGITPEETFAKNFRWELNL